MEPSQEGNLRKELLRKYFKYAEKYSDVGKVTHGNKGILFAVKGDMFREHVFTTVYVSNSQKLDNVFDDIEGKCAQCMLLYVPLVKLLLRTMLLQ